MSTLKEVYVNNRETDKVLLNNGIFYEKNMTVYLEITYIKSTRKQYIMTDYLANPRTLLEMELMMNGTLKYTGCTTFFGQGDSTYPYASFSVNFGTAAKNYTSTHATLFVWNNKSYGGGTTQITSVEVPFSIINYRNKLTLTNNRITWGTASTSLTSKTTTHVRPLVLVGGYPNYAFDAYDMYVYNTKISENGVVILDLKPVVRIEDGKTGLFDIVNKKFLPCVGTEEFICGSYTGVKYKTPKQS